MLCERCECSEGCNLSHLKPMKIIGKVAFCEGVNTFLGLKIRIYARREADGLVLSE